MIQKVRGLSLLGAAVVLSCACSQAAHAHFPWLDADEQGRVLAFFGESSVDRTYHLPEAIAHAQAFARPVDGDPVEVELAAVEEDEFIGRRSTQPAPKDAALEMTCQYGIYHGMLLTYYAQHLPGKDADSWKRFASSKALKFQIAPQAGDDPRELVLVATWDGKPRPGADVALTDAAEEVHEEKTNEQGEVRFKNVAGARRRHRELRRGSGGNS